MPKTNATIENTATPAPKRVKLDQEAAMSRHFARSAHTAADRFARAAETIERIPTGLSPEQSGQQTPTDTPPVIAEQRSITTASKGDFDIAQCVPGALVKVPFHLIDLNPVGPRQIYRSEEIDKIAQTLPEGQDDAVHGFLKDGRVVLIDGGTRYRSAKVSGVGFLDVKFEEAPSTGLDLYLRARRYNDQRSQPSVIDHALSLQLLLDTHAVETARDLIEKVPDLNGKGRMAEAQVSVYLRIARMPRHILERMSESQVTSQLTVLYAISEIFPKDEKPTSEQIDLSMQLIEEIKAKDLTKKQVQELVKSRLTNERKSRERSVQQPISYGSCKGYIKVFGKRGQIDLSLKGVKEENLPLLQRELQSLIERFANEHK